MTSVGNDVRQVVADVLGLTSVVDTTSTSTIDTWDSVQHLNLMVALEERFAMEFEPEEVEGMRSVAAIVEVIERKMGLANSNRTV